MTERPTHRVRSVVVNGHHIWECRGCGGRWNPNVNYLWIERQACEPAQFVQSS